MTDGPLKLRAEDAADIEVLAAVLQDAIAPVCDMSFRPAEKSFVMVVHRFCWDCVQAEPSSEANGCYQRICCALDVQGVESVQFVGFDPGDPALMLDLLTIMLQDGYLHMVFAGGAGLRLKLDGWKARIEDFGESWPTTHLPCHAT